MMVDWEILEKTNNDIHPLYITVEGNNTLKEYLLDLHNRQKQDHENINNIKYRIADMEDEDQTEKRELHKRINKLEKDIEDLVFAFRTEEAIHRMEKKGEI